MNLYRCAFEYPDGRLSRFTFASLPHDATRRAADLVRCFARGYLLAVWEERPCTVQLRLR